MIVGWGGGGGREGGGGEGGGGGWRVMSRHQSFVKSPCPYILFDLLCLDLELHEGTHLPRQVQSTDAIEDNRWNQYIMATSLFQGQNMERRRGKG